MATRTAIPISECAISSVTGVLRLAQTIAPIVLATHPKMLMDSVFVTTGTLETTVQRI